MRFMLLSRRGWRRASGQLRTPFALAAAALFCVAGMVTIGSGAASAASAAPRPARHNVITAARKPVPVRPASTPGLATGHAIPPKPSRSSGLRTGPADPAGGWTVTLTASPATLWPTQYSTLTATANADVGPTPYYIRIYDQTDGQYVATCGIGATCSLGVTEPTASNQEYVAQISDATGNAVVATSGSQWVVWGSISVTLADSPSTVADRDPSFLEALTSADVGPTPFYISIYDASTGVLVAQCGVGDVCPGNGQISWLATDTTNEFVAYVAGYPSSFPPPAIQAASYVFITATSSPWRVSLSGPGQVPNGGPATYTATANADVGPTPYWIEIFDATTQAPLAECGSGTTCSATFEPSDGGDDLVAFVSSLGFTLPPPNIQASSNTVHTAGVFAE